MTEFIRVRAVDGPKHEFHAPVQEVETHPDLYEVLDDIRVTTPEEPKYVLPKAAAEKPLTAAQKRAAAAAEADASAPAPTEPVGDTTTKENE